MNECWNVIKHDFYDLCSFFNHNLCMQSINGSYITLLPKVGNPSKVSDFRPISLLNSSIKLINKLLTNILQYVVLRATHQNQYGFLKSRSIHDCLVWSFEYLHLCHKSRKELVILKLDFERTFDKVELEVIIQVLEHKGFLEKWVKWVKGILNSGPL
jgi:hypothetical protein